MDTKQKVIELLSIVADAHSMLNTVREECTHPEGHYSYGGDTGNWCPDDDCYWKTFTCHHCGKVWTEYSELPGGARNDAYYARPQGWREEK